MNSIRFAVNDVQCPTLRQVLEHRDRIWFEESTVAQANEKAAHLSPALHSTAAFKQMIGRKKAAEARALAKQADEVARKAREQAKKSTAVARMRHSTVAQQKLATEHSDDGPMVMVDGETIVLSKLSNEGIARMDGDPSGCLVLRDGWIRLRHT